MLRLLFTYSVLIILLAPMRANAQNCTPSMLADQTATLDALLAAGCELTPDQISRAMDNPVGEMISIPFNYERRTISEPFFGSEQVIETITVIPTVPVNINDNWALVNRVALVFPRLPVDADALSNAGLDANSLSFGIGSAPVDLSTFSGETTGFGDLTYVGLFTPRETTPLGNGRLIWALGPTAVLPTASEDFLGQGKYQLGVAGVAAYLGEDWTLGLFPQHYWSVGGDVDRAEVNRTNIQYFIYRKLPNRWSIGASPTIAIDWTDDDDPKVDFPIGLGINKTAFISGVPVRFGLEYQHYLTENDGINPENGIKFSISAAAPAAIVRDRLR